MDRTTVIFVRHAQSLHPYSDERTRPLTETGMEDRSLVLDTLRGRHIDAFLSSPYLRSVQTVSPAAESFGLEVRTDERFRERLNGPGAGVPGTLEKRWTDFSFAEEGGESLGEVQRRNIEAINDDLRAYAGRTIVVGTHGTALSTILNYYDPSFGLEEYRGISYLMPYIVEMSFDGEELIEKKVLAFTDRSPR